jgi:hypothetical protein
MKYSVRKIVTLSMQELKKEILYLSPAKRPRKIIFDHLPKCGGSSLNKYLQAHYPRRKIFSINGLDPISSVDEFKNYSISKRNSYDLVKGHLANQLFDFVHPESIKVTVLREPIDRIVSHYFWAKRTPQHYLYTKIHDSEMNLEDYVTSGISEELRNWYTTHFSGLTVDDAEKNPDKAINRAIEVIMRAYDIIGLLDNLSFFLGTLRKKARLRYSFHNEKVNATRGRIAVHDIQQSIITKIEQANHLDVALYRKISGIAHLRQSQ